MSKVLIVDDAYSMRNLIKKTLREGGYTVVGEAKNGEEALELYRQLKPDFVTMDIKMPVMSGIDATKMILAEDPQAKIIVITGNHDDSMKEKVIKAGAKDYLRKPFQPAFLLKRVETLFEEPTETVIHASEERPVSSDAFEEPAIPQPKATEIIDDFFDDLEIELSNEPDRSKEAVFVIENQEDLIEFPKDYVIEEEKHALTEENLIEFIEEEKQMELSDDFEEIDLVSEPELLHELPPLPTEARQKPPLPTSSPSPPVSPSFHEKDAPAEEPSLINPVTKEEDSFSIPSFPSDAEEVLSPIRIRPPRGRPLEEYVDNEDMDEEEYDDFIIHMSDEQVQVVPEKKTKKLGFLKKIFKP